MKAIQELDVEIIGKVKNLNGIQKNDVLSYIERIPRKIHSSKRYRRRAMKQIRHALENQFA
jgi:ADP-dependent phosphofructokinase/glucokinase